jgi:hypothetical protein
MGFREAGASWWTSAEDIAVTAVPPQESISKNNLSKICFIVISSREVYREM